MKKTTQKQQAHSDFWNGTLFGTLLGMGSLLAYQYFSGILEQPRLISKELISEDGQFESKQALAMFIAAENLESGIQARTIEPGMSKKILHAGYRNFRESWARDFGFASYGLIALEEFDTVKDTLEAFFWHQTETGQLPVKLHSINVITRFFYSLFGREQPTELMLKPKFISGHGAASLDGQALLIIAALNYASEREDVQFLQDHWRQIKLSVQWLHIHRKEHDDILLNQDSYADWADSVARRGNVLYTNVVYWKVLSEMGAAATSMDMNQDAANYFSEAEIVARAIHEHFWRSDLGHFVTSDRLEQLSSDGNLLAIAWGLATAEQADTILQAMEEAGMAEPVPTRVVYPSYPPYLISVENVLGNLSNYHTNASWLWLGAWHVVALANSGRLKKAQELMERITEVIIRDRQVNEVHKPDGEPLSSFWYKSESPLTWNAGMIVYAYQILETKLGANANILSLMEIVE
jgi:glycogen debranching enzyme